MLCYPNSESESEEEAFSENEEGELAMSNDDAELSEIYFSDTDSSSVRNIKTMKNVHIPNLVISIPF